MPVLLQVRCCHKTVQKATGETSAINDVKYIVLVSMGVTKTLVFVMVVPGVIGVLTVIIFVR